MCEGRGGSRSTAAKPCCGSRRQARSRRPRQRGFWPGWKASSSILDQLRVDRDVGLLPELVHVALKDLGARFVKEHALDLGLVGLFPRTDRGELDDVVAKLGADD